MNGILALIAFASGFLLAQLWKLIERLIRREKRPKTEHFGAMIADLFRSGGMPSGHAASMTALTTFLGFAEGTNSGLFAVAVASTIIIIYDATHVRYAVGEQGKALNKILKKNDEKSLLVVEGHTMLEVIVGVMLGVVVGAIVYFMGVV